MLHAPAWIDGSLYYARTRGYTPGSACSDDIVRTAPGTPSTGEQVRSPLLAWVRDLEVDPQSEDGAAEVRLAFVDAHGAGLLWHGEVFTTRARRRRRRRVQLDESRHRPASRGDPQLEFWTRLGDRIDSVDVHVLLDAAKANGIETGLDVTTVEVVSISAYGSDSDQSFVVALRDQAGEVGAVQITIPYNADLEAQLDEVAGVDGVDRGAVPLIGAPNSSSWSELREPSS